MKITCDACGSKYSIADEKVRGKRVKVRCKGCQTSILVDGTSMSEDGSGDADDSGEEASAAPIDAASSPVKPKPKLPVGSWSVNLSDDDSRDMTTAELVTAWKKGEVTADAFVWKDGMGDWTRIQDVAELKSKLAAPTVARPAVTAAKPAAAAVAKPAVTAAKPAAAAAAKPDDGVTTSATTAAKPAPTKPGPGKPAPAAPAKPAAKASPKMDDLFGSIDFAGREEAAQAAAQGSIVDEKPKGTRNESSVLFSLDALKAGVEAEKPAAAAPSSDDPFGLGGGGMGAAPGMGGFGGFGGNAADLLTAPVKELPKPVVQAAPRPVVGISGPPTAEPKAKSKGVLIGAVVGVLALAGGAFAVFGGGPKADVQSASTSESSAPADTSAADAEKQKMTEQLAKAEADKKAMAEQLAKAEADKKPGEAAPADSAKKPDAVKPADTAAKPADPAAKPAEAKPAEVAAAAAKPEAKPAAPAAAPTAGGLDTAAAKAALAAAAGQVASCAKKGGPTGPGKVQVTFAPSGRVTSAVVSGGTYGGTPTGGCVASTFRSARVPAFNGAPVTVSKSFNINN